MDHQHPTQYNKHYTGKFLVTRETRPTKNKLEMCNEEGFGEDVTYLEGGSVSSSQQTRMASACGTMHPPVSGMNRGQGQGIDSVGYVTGRASLSLWPVKVLHEQSLKVTSILWSPCGAPSLTWSNICINRPDKQSKVAEVHQMASAAQRTELSLIKNHVQWPCCPRSTSREGMAYPIAPLNQPVAKRL